MAIGLWVGLLLIGFVLGLAFAIWIVTTAGYDWQKILHRWHIELVYRRHKAEIDKEVEAYQILADKPFSEFVEWLEENPDITGSLADAVGKVLAENMPNFLDEVKSQS